MRVAVIGATGAIGRVLLSILESRAFPLTQCLIVASTRSVGQSLHTPLGSQTILSIDDVPWSSCDLAFFCAGSQVAQDYVPQALAHGCRVIDASSHYRYEEDVPLVIPEINGHALKRASRGLVASPNCSTTQMLMALHPIQQNFGLETIVVSTYQAVSGSGQKGIDELSKQNHQDQQVQTPEASFYPKVIAGNAIPQIDTWMEEGYTKEEMKMIWETQKIFEDPSIQVIPTCVRIPVYYGHSESIYCTTQEPIDWPRLRRILSDTEGLVLWDDPSENRYPTPREHGQSDAVYLGRLRPDLRNPRGLLMWVVSDAQRKGGALNAVQIAERWRPGEDSNL